MDRVVLTSGGVITLFYLLEMGLGLFHGRWHVPFSYHFLLGVFVAMLICLFHSAVLFHFIGSGKEIKEFTEEMEPGAKTQLLSILRRFKAKTSPLATLCILLAVATTTAGAAYQTHHVSRWVHESLAYATFLLNLYTFVVEYQYTHYNVFLIQKLNQMSKIES